MFNTYPILIELDSGRVSMELQKHKVDIHIIEN